MRLTGNEYRRNDGDSKPRNPRSNPGPPPVPGAGGGCTRATASRDRRHRTARGGAACDVGRWHVQRAGVGYRVRGEEGESWRADGHLAPGLFGSQRLREMAGSPDRALPDRIGVAGLHQLGRAYRVPDSARHRVGRLDRQHPGEWPQRGGAGSDADRHGVHHRSARRPGSAVRELVDGLRLWVGGPARRARRLRPPRRSNRRRRRGRMRRAAPPRGRTRALRARSSGTAPCARRWWCFRAAVWRWAATR